MPDDQYNILQKILSGAISPILGTTSIGQAEKLGMPNAAGLNPQQLQILLSQPQYQQSLQAGQLGIQGQGIQNQAAQLQLDRMKQAMGGGNVPQVYTDPKTKTNFYTVTDKNGFTTYKPLPSATRPGAVSDQDISSNVQSMMDGTPLSLIGGFGSQKAKINAGYERARKDNPGLLSPVELENNFRAQAQRVRSLNSPQMVQLTQNVAKLNAEIDQANEIIDKLGNSNFIPANKIKQAISQGLYANSPYSDDVAKLNGLIQDIAFTSSQALGAGTPTDIRFKNEINRLNAAQTPRMFKNVSQTLKQLTNVGLAAAQNFQAQGLSGTPGNQGVPGGNGKSKGQDDPLGIL